VACTGGTQLGLGLLDLDGLSEQVLLTLSGVLLNELSHWRRWGDWEDAREVDELVARLSNGGITVQA